MSRTHQEMDWVPLEPHFILTLLQQTKQSYITLLIFRGQLPRLTFASADPFNVYPSGVTHHHINFKIFTILFTHVFAGKKK